MFTFVWIRAGTKVHHFLDELRSLPSCQHDSRFEPLIRWEQVICSKYILSVSTIKYLLTEWKNATVFIQFILCSNQDGNEDNVRRGVNDCKILNPPISGRWLYCILPVCDNGWTQATRASRDTLGSTDRLNLVLIFLVIIICHSYSSH